MLNPAEPLVDARGNDYKIVRGLFDVSEPCFEVQKTAGGCLYFVSLDGTKRVGPTYKTRLHLPFRNITTATVEQLEEEVDKAVAKLVRAKVVAKMKEIINEAV